VLCNIDKQDTLMWVQRTPEEIAKWRSSAEKEARSTGLTIGLIGWGLAVILLSAGWVVSFRGGMAVQRNFGGTFWTRLPIFALLASPVIFIARRVESRKSLKSAELRTVCITCDSVGENNASAACNCGGTFVPSSTVRWVE
jgi:hypothetical protein